MQIVSSRSNDPAHVKSLIEKRHRLTFRSFVILSSTDKDLDLLRQ